jgi:hypothetical protein
VEAHPFPSPPGGFAKPAGFFGDGAAMLLASGSLRTLGVELEHTSAREASHLEFARELRDDVPALRADRALDRSGERVFERRIAWPNDGRLSHTYVNSRRFFRAKST